VSVIDVPTIGMHLDLAAEEDMRWHRDVRFYRRAFAALADCGLLLEPERMDVGKDEVPFDRKAFTRSIAAKKTGMVELWAKSREHASVSAGGILADIKAHMFLPSRETLDALIAWARAVAKLPEGRARVRRGTVYPIDLDFPARRPPVTHKVVRLGTIVDFFGPVWLSGWAPDLIELVSDAELPRGASRIRDEELIVMRWGADPASPDAFAEACMRQEDWWRAHLDIPPDGGWNRAGDRAVYAPALEPAPPFTLVDRAQHVGYRALAVTPDGAVDDAAWTELAELTALRQLADGTPIDRVRLIAPTRAAALAIVDRARDLGVDAVLYEEGDRLFDVTPPGNWRLGP
jgi:hypothetical protein